MKILNEHRRMSSWYVKKKSLAATVSVSTWQSAKLPNLGIRQYNPIHNINDPRIYSQLTTLNSKYK